MIAHTPLMEGVVTMIEIIVIVTVIVIMIVIEGEEKGTDMMTEMGMGVVVEEDTMVAQMVVGIGVLLVAAMTSEDEAVNIYIFNVNASIL